MSSGQRDTRDGCGGGFPPLSVAVLTPNMTEPPPVVLIAEDERQLADAYTGSLVDTYDVRTVYRGTDALEALDETVDVVLLDRRMPDIDGDEVLSTIRDRGLSCRVAMVTAVEPDFDILQMGFDEYLCKPIRTEDLRQTVARLVDLAAFDSTIREQLQLAAKLSALRETKSDAELEENEEYQELRARLGTLSPAAREQIDELLDQRSTEWVLERMVGP